LRAVDRRAWNARENICGNFWGNQISENYIEIMDEELLSTYRALGCNMSLKTPFPAIPLEFLFSPGNTAAVSDEYGERFYQDKTRKKKRYSSKWNQKM